VKIRPARPDDAPRLLEIYNHYVEHTHATFDLEPLTLAQRRRWLEEFRETGPHRLLVAERAHVIEGYASSRAFRERAAYDRSVETSVYLAPEAIGRGLGSRLYAELLEGLEAESLVHRAYGGVALPNEASVALHLRMGFKQVASFSEVGFKFGRYWDVVWFERAL
jgi:phosphinothricin acetyltransferase